VLAYCTAAYPRPSALQSCRWVAACSRSILDDHTPMFPREARSRCAAALKRRRTPAIL